MISYHPDIEQQGLNDNLSIPAKLLHSRKDIPQKPLDHYVKGSPRHAEATKYMLGMLAPASGNLSAESKGSAKDGRPKSSLRHYPSLRKKVKGVFPIAPVKLIQDGKGKAKATAKSFLTSLSRERPFVALSPERDSKSYIRLLIHLQ